VAAVHVYFPDPWPKTRHRHRRLFERQDLADAIARVLVRGGAVHVATDLLALGERARARLHAAGLREGPASAPVRPASKVERKYAAAGTWAATFVRDDPPTRRGRAAPAGPAPPARRTPRSRSAP